MKVGFNKPYFSGKEIEYIMQAIRMEKISGDGHFTHLCQQFFNERYGFKKTLLTTSCTDALEMAAILLEIQPGDEVILPSFTFVSTANPFLLRGATIRFADSEEHTPNIDVASLEKLITEKTKAIIVVHYAGVACDMDAIMDIAAKHNLFVVEDAAQAINATYKGKYLGGIGHIGCFSFHETKNIMAGEGGLLVINDDRFVKRSDVIWEKGTNRTSFNRGEVAKYGWIDIGSSFLPSELIAAFLYAQLENLDAIQQRRLQIWNYYYEHLKNIPQIQLAQLPSYASNNAHIFYILCQSFEQRSQLITYLKEQQIQAIFHYLPLHSSPYFSDKHDERVLTNTVHFADCLLRLPCYYELSYEQQDFVIKHIRLFFENNI